MTNLKQVSLVAFCSMVVGCSEPYDYSGIYVATKGDACELQSGDNTFITISHEGAEGLYSAKLSTLMSANGVFPTQSKNAKVAEDGSLTFSFFKEGKTGFFSGKPSVDMTMTLREVDDSYIVLESWPVSMFNPKDASKLSSFDLVKDAEIDLMGKKNPNEIAAQAGAKGLCLVSESELDQIAEEKADATPTL